MDTPDRQWILARMADAGLKQRDLAARVEMDHTAISKVLSGKRRLTVGEAQRVADAIKVPLGDLVAHLGGEVEPGFGQTVPMIGSVDGAGVVSLYRTPGERVQVPWDVPTSGVALVCNGPAGSPYPSGSILIASREQGDPADAVGRLALVTPASSPASSPAGSTPAGRPFIAHLGRGSRGGTYLVHRSADEPPRSVSVAAAAPVLWIRF